MTNPGPRGPVASPPGARRLWLATGNAHKVTEIAAILGPGFTVEARDTGVDETGDTFEANALLKARALCAATGELALADDSGIAVDALDGAPGVHSARWVEEGRWISELLARLEGQEGDQRSARYVCAAAAVWPDGTEVVEVSTIEGHVAGEPRGANGFGYDPIFAPVEAGGPTFGELPPEAKETLSHRARAFRALLAHLG